MDKHQYQYRVVAIEQMCSDVWSHHRTYDAALAAAKKYRRKNPDTDHWSDHRGYRIDRLDDNGVWRMVARLRLGANLDTFYFSF